MPEAESAAAVRGAMESTAVPLTITRRDGSREEGTARVVHPAGAPVPPRVDHKCGDQCGRCAP